MNRTAMPYAMLLALLALTEVHADAPLARVDALDLERYQGLWYEIARLPNRFQDQCVADTTAEYTLLESGRMRVVNRCRTSSGGFDRAEGIARRPDPDEPARLEVRFAPRWLSWLPVVWGDYHVLALGEDYDYALIGEPSRTWLWILARRPDLPESRIRTLLAEAERQGFPVDEVRRTEHGAR